MGGVSTVKGNHSQPDNPSLPQEVTRFKDTSIEVPLINFTADEWLAALRSTEIRDKEQQIFLRPYFAGGMYLLLIIQNIGIWLLVAWALDKNQLVNLQLIFSTLIAGSLTQSYFILRLITKKIFDEIDYHNSKDKHE